jgi:undecaprenyl diphosphate synthase
LLNLFKLFFQKHGEWLNSLGVRLNFIGRRDNLDIEILRIIEEWTEATESNEQMILTIAGNYGGRDEIVRAINRILAQGDVHEIGEQGFGAYLDTSVMDIPDPDLIIRTSGEQRLSGFMSWQSAYSELYFSDKLMPDWTGDDLVVAMTAYSERQRRFGT